MAVYEMKTVMSAFVYSDSDAGDTLIELERSVAEDGDERIVLTVRENMLSIEEAKILHSALGELLATEMPHD